MSRTREQGGLPHPAQAQDKPVGLNGRRLAEYCRERTLNLTRGGCLFAGAAADLPVLVELLRGQVGRFERGWFGRESAWGGLVHRVPNDSQMDDFR
jgi:hypothetical protein